MMAVFYSRHNQLNFGLYYKSFVIHIFFLLCTLGTPWANYSVHKKCGNATMLWYGQNTVFTVSQVKPTPIDFVNELII